ncbi:MAG: hypothetical protein ABF446_08410 [Acetobacter orientalis]|uniref:hypothetical protein n=1 Tax=Acetobacter orientalis TaxID=146474 RepID=UPI0039EC8494
MTDQKPTGVFVRLPLSNEQLGKLLAPIGPLNERLLAIGTPVAGGELEVVCYSHEIGNTGSLVRQSDAIAKLAEKDAEIVRLREGLTLIAESENIDNCLDPARNKRVAVHFLKGGAA